MLYSVGSKKAQLTVTLYTVTILNQTQEFTSARQLDEQILFLQPPVYAICDSPRRPKGEHRPRSYAQGFTKTTINSTGS